MPLPRRHFIQHDVLHDLIRCKSLIPLPREIVAWESELRIPRCKHEILHALVSCLGAMTGILITFAYITR